jgi:hypothetical protein
MWQVSDAMQFLWLPRMIRGSWNLCLVHLRLDENCYFFQATIPCGHSADAPLCVTISAKAPLCVTISAEAPPVVMVSLPTVGVFWGVYMCMSPVKYKN